MAQLGARLDGIEEVVGSNPIGSTKFIIPFSVYSLQSETTHVPGEAGKVAGSIPTVRQKAFSSSRCPRFPVSVQSNVLRTAWMPLLVTLSSTSFSFSLP